MRTHHVCLGRLGFNLTQFFDVVNAGKDAHFHVRVDVFLAEDFVGLDVFGSTHIVVCHAHFASQVGEFGVFIGQFGIFAFGFSLVTLNFDLQRIVDGLQRRVGFFKQGQLFLQAFDAGFAFGHFVFQPFDLFFELLVQIFELLVLGREALVGTFGIGQLFCRLSVCLAALGLLGLGLSGRRCKGITPLRLGLLLRRLGSRFEAVVVVAQAAYFFLGLIFVAEQLTVFFLQTRRLFFGFDELLAQALHLAQLLAVRFHQLTDFGNVVQDFLLLIDGPFFVGLHNHLFSNLDFVDIAFNLGVGTHKAILNGVGAENALGHHQIVFNQFVVVGRADDFTSSEHQSSDNAHKTYLHVHFFHGFPCFFNIANRKSKKNFSEKPLSVRNLCAFSLILREILAAEPSLFIRRADQKRA